MKTRVEVKRIETLVIVVTASELIGNMIVGSVVTAGGLLDMARAPDNTGTYVDYCNILDNLSEVHEFAAALRNGMVSEASVILKHLLGVGGIHPKIALSTLDNRVKEVLLKGGNREYILEVQNDLGEPFALQISSNNIIWQ